MDNLHQEEDGSLTLVRGIQKIGGVLSDFVEVFFSRNNEANELTYVGTGDGHVYKMTDLGSPTSLLAGNDHVAFGDAYGKTLICAGTTKKKEAGGVLTNLGITKPATKPTLGVVSQPKKDLATGSWIKIEGHDEAAAGASIQCFVDSTTLQGVVEMDIGDIDTTNLGTSGPYDLQQDTFTFLLQTHDKDLLRKLRFELHIDDQNYFWHEWEVDTDSSLNVGINAQSVLSCKRGDFVREGADGTKSWDHIAKCRVTCQAIVDTYFLVGEQQFLGGAAGVLNGFYKYMSVAVANDGTYLGKSPKSDDSDIAFVSNGYITVTSAASSDSQVTEYWHFRRSVVQQIDTSLPQSHLDKWYRVGVGSSIDDKMSDTDAILLNITFDETVDSVANISDSILSIEGMYNERMLYMTFNQVYLSDRLNPDGYIPGITLKVSGDTTEKNLWIKKVTNSTLILATTKDLYEISGTLLNLPDGSIDVYIRPIGEAFPPLGMHVAAEEGILYYAAKDGIRGTTGTNSTLLSPSLSQLYQGRSDVNGVPSISVIPGSVGDYALATGRNKLYAAVPMSDGTRRLIIYNFISRTWRLQYTDPTAVGGTTTGHILVGYGGGSGNYVRELDKGTGVDGSGGLPFTFLTVFDPNQQPRNRKDTFTLKLVLDTGGNDVDVYLAKDGGTFTNIKTVNCNGLTTKYIKVTGQTLGFRYALKLKDKSSDLTSFKLDEYTIEYDARPEQVNYLRLPATNLGSSARKRFVAFAFVIDTLGQDVTFTPLVDGAAGTPSTVNTDGKLTYIHYFTSDTVGTDIGGILESDTESNPFEFYEVSLSESISEKMPAPTKFLLIPANDFGSPNRKRHTSYKFQINTKGHNVTFTPKVDGATYASATFNTSEKRTVDYYFDTSIDVVGVDIGGTLSGSFAFEFYGVIIPQEVEVLPARLESLYLPVNNFGTAARKRVRTIPMVIDTRGGDVTFSALVDGVAVNTSTFNTSYKQTVFHFFETDVLGYDFAGILIGPSYFEFYGYGEGESVEILPVVKKYDQSQPFRFDRIGKIFALRIKMIVIDDVGTIPIKVMGDESAIIPSYGTELYAVNMPVIAGVDNIYQVDFPKSINATVFRVVIGPSTSQFHRYDIQVRVAASGMETDAQWVTLR
jgi:hypothetical protein